MNTAFRTLALLTASALTLAACAGDRNGEWAGTTTDSAGVTVVNNPAAANWTLRSQPRLTEELRIGAMDGAPELQFGQIAALDVDDDGAIYVLDTQAASVRVFDRDGRHLRSVGRAGGAPGEFSATTAAVLAGNDGVVYIADVMRRRIAALGPDGVEIGSTPLMMQEGIPVR
jgi:DNA-binding beta-propeller fold protein YncE